MTDTSRKWTETTDRQRDN